MGPKSSQLVSVAASLERRGRRTTVARAVVTGTNVDAGGNEIASAIHHFRDEGLAERCHFIHNLASDHFLRLMAHCACMIGNSPAALREGGYLGTPASASEPPAGARVRPQRRLELL